jgi:hypothetical protein
MSLLISFLIIIIYLVINVIAKRLYSKYFLHHYRRERKQAVEKLMEELEKKYPVQQLEDEILKRNGFKRPYRGVFETDRGV